MLTSLFEVYFPDRKEELKNKNYTTINDAGFEPLLEMLSDEDSFKKYVKEIVVAEESNNKELSRVLYRVAKNMLEHRSGTRYEDMWLELWYAMMEEHLCILPMKE